MPSYLQDIFYSARTVIKARAFTAVCVASLGLGMGIVIAMMLLVRMLTGTPEGVDDNGLAELVIRPQGALLAQSGSAILDSWSYPDYLDVRDGARGMTVTGFGRAEAQVRLPNQPAPMSVAAMYVSSNYFANVGITLPRGRGFTAADDATLAPAEAVIAYRVWQLQFNSDPNIIGASITIDQTEYVVVGVAPEKFRGHVSGLDNAFYSWWLPLSRHPQLRGDKSARLNRDVPLVRILARLPETMTVAQADAMVRSVMTGIADRYPTSNRDKTGGAEEYFGPGARMRPIVFRVKSAFFGLSGMVLLIVGLNISGMMLVRSAMRERELAIRLAMGASRWRLMRFHFSEAFVMSLFGGSIASALLFGAPLLVSWWANYYGPELDLFRPDIWIALQCVALCFVTSLVLGLLPALRFSRPAILAALKNDATGSGRRVGRLQRLTAALQTGIAVPFLVIGLIRVDQARVTAMADAGFQPHGLYAVRLNLPGVGKTTDDQQRFVRTVRDSLAQSAGVRAVTLGDGLPLDFNYRNTRVARERQTTFFQAHTTRIAPEYLETVGIRLLAGRSIDATDRAEGERVVLLSEPLARQLFPEGNPVGQRVSFAVGGGEETYTVVGITADVVSTQMGNPRPQLFVSLAQHPASTVLAIVRGQVDDPAVRRAFEQALTSADRDYVLREVISGQDLIDRSYSDILSQGAVSGVAAAVALVLATLGVYGVIAFMVTTRTREIGVRVALGASRARVLKDVLGGALMLVVPGIVIGLAAATFVVRVMDPTWYELGAVEPLIYAVAAAVAFAVAALAGVPSARRAAGIEPMVAIRTE